MKAQTSIEIIFLVAVILVIASILFFSYTQESLDVIAETTIRTQAELMLSAASLQNASCASAVLQGIRREENNYYIHVIPADCAHTAFNENALKEMHGRINEALGCRYSGEYTDRASCKGKTYTVKPAEQI